MMKLTIAAAGLAAIIGCTDGPDRSMPASEPTERDLVLSRTEETPGHVERTVPERDPEPARAPRVRDTATDHAGSDQAGPVTRSRPSTRSDTASTHQPEPASQQTETPAAPAAPAPELDADTGGYAPYPRDPRAEPVPDTAAPPGAIAAGTVAAGTSAAGTVAAGTPMYAALDDSIHSRHDVSGKAVTGRLMENVRGPDGRALIAAGSPVHFTLTQVKPGRGDRPGVLEMRVDAVAIDGEPRKLEATVRPIPHELRGRGVTGEEAAKVGAGAAGGAVVGRVLGGDAKGAVIGGVVGAAGGAVVASETAAKDVVVKARTPVTFVLTAPLVVAP
jgi:hypothetical protein